MRKETTRQALKDCALRCFGERGFLVTTIDDITDAAGVAHATFYTHFESKDAIFEEIQSDFQQGLFERLTPVLENVGGSDILTSARIAAGLVLEYWDGRREYIAAFLRGTTPATTLNTVRSGQTAVVRDALTDGLVSYARERGIDLPGASLVIGGITAMWTRVGLSYLYQDGEEGPPISREVTIDTLAKMTFGVLSQFLSLGEGS
ncbi:MAG: TetR/AcrR family transcriptional regulator [Myxococcales bacterium]|nr:TetR/AcrR family transcriptional regulator [Myxococcales bacterium]